MKKRIRQKHILELIDKYEIGTQEELLEYLINRGINTTQATVSRDVKELKLIKVQISNSKYKYVAMDHQYKAIDHHLMEILKYSILNIEKSGNLIVINTIPNAAKLCASAIKGNDIQNIVGIIAEDDTIFIAIRDMGKSDMVLEKIKSFIK